MKNQAIECVEAQIMYLNGVKKALIQTKKSSMFTNKYNKGYYDAVNDQVQKLNELKIILEDECTQELNQVAV